MTAQGDARLLKLAEEEAGKAIATGRDIVGGYHQFGVAKLYQGAFDESIEAFELAETISPHYADVVIADYADTLMHASKPGEALEKVERAIKAQPAEPGPLLLDCSKRQLLSSTLARSASAYTRAYGRSFSGCATCAASAQPLAGDTRKAKALVRKVKETYPDFKIDTGFPLFPPGAMAEGPISRGAATSRF